MKFKVFHCSWESFIHTRVIKLIESLRLKLYLNTYDVGRRMLQDIRYKEYYRTRKMTE